MLKRKMQLYSSVDKNLMVLQVVNQIVNNNSKLVHVDVGSRVTNLVMNYGNREVKCLGIQ